MGHTVYFGVGRCKDNLPSAEMEALTLPTLKEGHDDHRRRRCGLASCLLDRLILARMLVAEMLIELYEQ